MNKNNKRDHLFRSAFKLFLSKPFDAVSIVDIEETSGMTRGAITYYGKNKLGLFHEVVKHFLVNTQNLKQKMAWSNVGSLEEFIEAYVNGCQKTLDGFKDIDENVQNASSAYMGLILQICKFFPDLHEEYLKNRNHEMLLWIDCIQKAINSGEIQSNVDVMSTAKCFMDIFYGQSYLDSLSMGLNTVELRMQMMNLYKLLKH